MHGFIDKARKEEQAWEGSADSTELDYLAKLARRPTIKLIGEIGFNGGLSSYKFLESNPDVEVISFDLGEYSYVEFAKRYIDSIFPNRHKLIIGDSQQTVPKFNQDNPDIKFDLIFIDGGHSYKVAKNDLLNMKPLAHKDTILMMDDLTPWLRWGKGPTKAWLEALEEGLVAQEELIKDGKVVETIQPPGERSWAVGRYVA